MSGLVRWFWNQWLSVMITCGYFIKYWVEDRCVCGCVCVSRYVCTCTVSKSIQPIIWVFQCINAVTDADLGQLLNVYIDFFFLRIDCCLMNLGCCNLFISQKNIAEVVFFVFKIRYFWEIYNSFSVLQEMFCRIRVYFIIQVGTTAFYNDSVP